MIISKSYIRSLSANLPPQLEDKTLVFAVEDIDRFSERLVEIGFSSQLEVGETVLPKPVGPRSEFNAEGDYEVHTDEPKKTVYHQREWTWTEWHGPYRREKSKIVDVPYERYPRTFIEPPSLELSIATDADDNKVVVTPSIDYREENEDELLHAINLMLELFGECSVLDEEMEEIVLPRVERRNWDFLPQGEYPWEEVEEQVRPHIEKQPEEVQPAIEKRLDVIRSHEPDFVAVGRAGFSGYLVFGFPEKEMFVLESVRKNNATYVFGEDWERLSKMTKAQILSGDLQKDRIIHREGWEQSVHRLLKE